MVSASQRTEQSEASGDGREIAAFAAGLARLKLNLRYTSRKQSCNKIQSRVKVTVKEPERSLSKISLAEDNFTHPSNHPRRLSVKSSLPPSHWQTLTSFWRPKLGT